MHSVADQGHLSASRPMFKLSWGRKVGQIARGAQETGRSRGGAGAASNWGWATPGRANKTRVPHVHSYLCTPLSFVTRYAGIDAALEPALPTGFKPRDLGGPSNLVHLTWFQCVMTGA